MQSVHSFPESKTHDLSPVSAVCGFALSACVVLTWQSTVGAAQTADSYDYFLVNVEPLITSQYIFSYYSLLCQAHVELVIYLLVPLAIEAIYACGMAIVHEQHLYHTPLRENSPASRGPLICGKWGPGVPIFMGSPTFYDKGNCVSVTKSVLSAFRFYFLNNFQFGHL